VRLASQLTGWDIDILTEAEESERRQAEFASRSATFAEALDVDEVIAQLLASEGFSSIEEVAYVPLDEIAEIEGFDEDTAQEIQSRALDYIDRQNAEFDEKRKALGVEDALGEIEGVTPKMLVAFGENGIKTVEDLAGCATDDLTGWNETVNGERKHQKGALEGFDVSEADANALIMKARIQMGWITQADLDADAAAKAEAEEVEQD
jgi:N utilization substance protein A